MTVEWTKTGVCDRKSSTRPTGPVHVDAILAAIAEANAGVVTLERCLAAGITPGAIRARLRSGHLHEIYRGVYAVGTRDLPRHGHLLAAARACGSAAKVTHRSSLGLQEVLGDARAKIDVTAPNRRGRSIRGIRAHASTLHLDDVTECRGVPCSTVPRALLEIAGTEPPRLLRQAFRESLRMGLLDWQRLYDAIGRVKRPRGVRALRAVIAEFDPEVLNAANPFEERAYDLCVAAGLPRPLVNRPLSVEGRTYRPDLLFPGGLIVEEDGKPDHTRLDSRTDDLDRERRLTRAGYRVRRFSWEQLTYRPEYVVARIRALLHPE